MIENDIILGNNSSVISQSSDFIRDKNYARDIMLKENCEERVNEEISSNPNIKFDTTFQLLIIQKKTLKTLILQVQSNFIKYLILSLLTILSLYFHPKKYLKTPLLIFFPIFKYKLLKTDLTTSNSFNLYNYI